MGWRVGSTVLGVVGLVMTATGFAAAQDDSGKIVLPPLSELLRDLNANPSDVLGGTLLEPFEQESAPAADPMASLPAEMRPAQVYRQSVRSIARVITTIPVDGGSEHGIGTAFIVDALGDLVTNCHVVSDDDGTATGPLSFEIEFSDDQVRMPAELLGCDENGDIAVIRVAGLDPSRPPLTFAPWWSYAAGDDVVTIGYARGIYGDPTISEGIISGLHRSLASADFSDLVQTDANINHGNSGGPLLNMRGQVVGVNTYTIVPTVDVSKISQLVKDDSAGPKTVAVDSDFGIYYARSSFTAQRFADEIIANGRVRRLDLGIDFAAYQSKAVKFPRLAVQADYVYPGSLGEALGMQRDLFVYAIEWPDRSMTTTDWGALNDALGFVSPGDSVVLKTFTLNDAGYIAATNQLPIDPADVTFRDIAISAEQTIAYVR